MNRRQFVMSSCAITGTTVLALPNAVLASGIPVFDAANLAQSILSAIRALQSNINEALMIENQIEQLYYEFRNTLKLEVSTIEEFSEQIHALFDAVGSVDGLMQDLASLEHEFEQLYPDFSKFATPQTSEQISQQVTKWLGETREMVKGAARTGGQALEALPSSQAKLEELLQNSQTAEGILQAAQAGNQISGAIAQQLMTISGQLATYSQAHMSYMMRETERDLLKKNRREGVLKPLTPSSEQSVTMKPF